MITILHGDNQEASRNELGKLIVENKTKEILQLNGKNISELSLLQALQSQSLLAEARLIVLENFLGNLNLKQKASQRLVDLLNQENANLEIILWENKPIELTKLKLLKGKVVVREHKFPALIFQFLDNLKLPLLLQVLETASAEVVFALLVKRIRQLMLIKDGLAPKELVSWQLSRLTNQAKSFTLEKLIMLDKQLAQIDQAIKTGKTPYNLTSLLTQLVISI